MSVVYIFSIHSPNVWIFSFFFVDVTLGDVTLGDVTFGDVTLGDVFGVNKVFNIVLGELEDI
jgi:hypothetical protein